MSNQRIVHLNVRGRVQGVGFRAFVEEEASDRSLEGWVRNRRDGSVEVLIAGPREAVDSMIEAVRHGPPASRVEAVDVREADETAFEKLVPHAGFSTLPTI